MRSPLPLLLLLSLPAPACSTSVALLATADTEGRVGGELRIEMGFLVVPLDGAERVELSLGGGPTYDGEAYARVGVGLEYVDSDMGYGIGQRLGLHGHALGSFDTEEEHDPFWGVGVSYSLLGTLDRYTGGIAGMIRWHNRDQLGATVSAEYRGGSGYADRVVFGLGPRYTLHVGDD